MALGSGQACGGCLWEACSEEWVEDLSDILRRTSCEREGKVDTVRPMVLNSSDVRSLATSHRYST